MQAERREPAGFRWRGRPAGAARWRRLAVAALALLLLAFAAPPARLLAAPATGTAATSDPAALEREAQAIEELLRCPVCNGESVAESQTAESAQMRAQIRQMLAEGKSRQQILDYYVRNFGIWILNEPPRQGAFLAVWLLPLLGLAAGAAALAFWLRSRLRPAADRGAGKGDARPAPAAAAVEEELRRWL
ncbi:MAG: cytochrome c-type biogenesis protein CcmH [Clostridia bacterium]|nr:cytochrome c-type biogenesis protein CcmH [Clostridia bacterium]